MTIVQQGSINTTALVVPDLYVQIVPPQNLVINGVPTNIIGMVGSASWGPLDQPAIVSNMADYARQFGPIIARKYDMGTVVATATQQGATNFRCVRVGDGSQTAATSAGVLSCITFTAIYTGSLGNALSVTISPGTKTGSFRAVVGLPGFVPEVFDNIMGSGNAFWVNLGAAINLGGGVQRGPSQLIVASVSTGVTTPVPAAYSFSGGADGAATPSTVATAIIGLDTLPRKGMYALRSQRCSIGVLCDLDASATWTVQASFGLDEGVYMIATGPSGDTITNAVTVKAGAGLDTYAVKLMMGDWVLWSDPVNGLQRYVSPQGFVAGRLGNLSPEQSSLNKPVYGVVGTQKGAGATTAGYSAAELGALFQPGIDVISNPQPGGNYWGARLGHNSSSNSATSGDNYTRMTNYIAATLNAGMGLYVGQVVNTTLFQRIRATLLAFFQNMLQQGLLGSVDGSLPFSVVCDASNNPFSRTSLGYVQADCQVQYQAILEKFIVNVEGGQTVSITRQTTPVGQSAT